MLRWSTTLLTLLLAAPASADECLDRLRRLDPWMESGEFSEISSDRVGITLIGLRCAPEQITAWIEDHGWTLVWNEEREPDQAGPSGETYVFDRTMRYCYPRGMLMRWATGGCSSTAFVTMLGNRITHLTAGPEK